MKTPAQQATEMMLSWLRVFLAASLTWATATGGYDLEGMATAGLAAVIPMVIRFLDPMDKAYGRGVNE